MVVIPQNQALHQMLKNLALNFFFFLELHHSVELLNNCYFQERVILDEFPKHRYKKNHHLDVFFNPKSVIYNYIFYFITFCQNDSLFAVIILIQCFKNQPFSKHFCINTSQGCRNWKNKSVCRKKCYSFYIRFALAPRFLVCRISRGNEGNLFILGMVDPTYRVPVQFSLHLF